MEKNKPLLLLAGMLLLGLLVRANDGKADCSSPLQGYVTDAVTKKPVSGVVVSAVPAGSKDPREVTTDTDGFYHFADLPPTQVSVQFGKKGYQLYKRSGLQIKEKTCIKINVEFMRNDDEGSESSGDAEYPLLRMLEMN